MKFLTVIIIAFGIFSSSCSERKPKTEATTPAAEQSPVKEQLKAGEIISAVACSNDAAQTYSLYLPSTYSDSVKYPVIIFFDPHGSGSFPLSKYKSLADQFGTILMGSNNSKNGLQFDQTNAIVNSLITEASTRFSSDMRRISLAGFSGGSKVALVAASNHPELLSVIYCGAAIPFGNIQQLPPALGFAGEKDMNYLEVMASSSELEQKKIIHHVIEWKGKHEWPDSSAFEEAFYWCSFSAMRSKSFPVNRELISAFLRKENKTLSALHRSRDQYNLNKKISVFLRGIADVSSYEQKTSAIQKSELFKSEMQKQQNNLQLESRLKQNYGECFGSKDLNWWKTEIARMRTIKNDQEMMYQRLLGYLSLASYSYSNNAIKQNNFSSAEQFLAIYKLADPENSEQPFLTACMFARQGNDAKAVEALGEAVRLGLKDKAKIESEESFSGLHSNAEFNRLLSGL
ncbi:MAG: hypothetical protein NT126_03020 [Bacteroidetes bacterium]|nr:hypothetical protein [Bacteroidota bacterium]